MAKSKRPRKRHNPNKGRDLYLTHFAKKLVLESWDSEQTPGKPASFACNQPQHVLAYAVGTQQRWLVECFVKCIDSYGGQYTEAREIVSNDPVRVNDLAQFAIAQLDDAEASVNPKHIVDRGWRARILTPELARELEAA